MFDGHQVCVCFVSHVPLSSSVFTAGIMIYNSYSHAYSQILQCNSVVIYSCYNLYVATTQFCDRLAVNISVATTQFSDRLVVSLSVAVTRFCDCLAVNFSVAITRFCHRLPVPHSVATIRILLGFVIVLLLTSL